MSEIFTGTARSDGDSLIVRPSRGQRMIKLTDDAPISVAVSEAPREPENTWSVPIGSFVFDARGCPIGVLTDVVAATTSFEVTQFGDEVRRFEPGQTTVTGTITMFGFAPRVAASIQR